jgi:hypothetical protein
MKRTQVIFFTFENGDQARELRLLKHRIPTHFAIERHTQKGGENQSTFENEIPAREDSRFVIAGHKSAKKTTQIKKKLHKYQ